MSCGAVCCFRTALSVAVVVLWGNERGSPKKGGSTLSPSLPFLLSCTFFQSDNSLIIATRWRRATTGSLYHLGRVLDSLSCTHLKSVHYLPPSLSRSSFVPFSQRSRTPHLRLEHNGWCLRVDVLEVPPRTRIPLLSCHRHRYSIRIMVVRPREPKRVRQPRLFVRCEHRVVVPQRSHFVCVDGVE